MNCKHTLTIVGKEITLDILHGKNQECKICKRKGHVASMCTVFKSKLCIHHLQGSCKFGDSCNFAHSRQELRTDINGFALRRRYSQSNRPEVVLPLDTS